MEKASNKLLRHLLGSIDFSDVEEELGDEGERARAGDAELFYKKHFEKLIKKFILEQLRFIGMGTVDKKGRKFGIEDDKQLKFAQGTINGLSLIKNWFEEQVAISLSRFEEGKEEEPKPGEPFEKI